jgi:hypothetical protein
MRNDKNLLVFVGKLNVNNLSHHRIITFAKTGQGAANVLPKQMEESDCGAFPAPVFSSYVVFYW